MLNSWRADAAVWARTETMRLIRVNQLRKWRMKEIEQGWDAANSLSLTSRRNLCQIAVRSLRMIAKRPRVLPDLTSQVISSKRPSVWSVGVISIYITLTPEAARNPQILSSVMRKSKSLFHDLFFSETPSMIMLPLHKQRNLCLLSLLWFQSTFKASGREPAHSLCSVKVIECVSF